MAEFWRALRTLKALQAEQALDTGPALAAHPVGAHPKAPAARAPLVHRPQPDEPERLLEYTLPEPPAPGRTLHEPAAPWVPNEPAPRQKFAAAPARPDLAPNEPEPQRARRPDRGRTTPPPAPRRRGNARHKFPGSRGPSEQIPNPWLRFR
jgi:hypothetical protein